MTCCTQLTGCRHTCTERPEGCETVAIAELTFDYDHWFLDDLPGDQDARVHPRQVTGAAYSLVEPTRTDSPTLAAHSAEVAALLGIKPGLVDTDQFAKVFSGNEILPGMAPFAANYGGHQFGHWAGQLGDGRAIALGEVKLADGGHQTLQLKGAGPTPYSRSADGRAVLRSSVREFLCSEAMHHLGVPTTRALSLALTGDKVMRDVMYDGHPAPEAGAVVCRVAPSFVRFGSFELPASRGEENLLRAFVEHTIRRLFPYLVPTASAGKPLTSDVLVAWLQEVADLTADLMVDWMRVGFVHGVMNTDNLSILGLTIDYGPYGWLENYDPDWTPNTTDAQGRRYRYGNQPEVGLWNLVRLANALYPLIGEAAPLERVLDSYASRYANGWNGALRAKLGLSSAKASDADVIGSELLALLPRIETDMTIFFRLLGDLDLSKTASNPTNEELVAPLLPAYYLPEELAGDVLAATASWVRSYRAISGNAGQSGAERQQAMHAVNPKYVLRNYLAQMAIDEAETGEFGLIDDLLDILRKPFDEQPDKHEFGAKRPDWARDRVGCSMLSCSS